MLRTAYELSAGMLSFVVALAIGWWFGRTLDRWFGTTWLVWLFLAFGLVAGVLNVIRTLSRALGTDPGRTGDGPGTESGPSPRGNS
jgi:F0F1-type ATP synthase assembly protein I